MKKKLLKFFIIIGALALLLTLISTTQVQAVTLQANSNTHSKGSYILTEWMTYFREMEKTGGALGLSETIDGSLVATSSNNLDSHMVKSTEYGAAAILSASGYGNPKILQESTIKTTTGNETGVYFDYNYWEWVAGGSGKEVSFIGMDTRYYDAYPDNDGDGREDTPKRGDALGTKDDANSGCAGWHLAGSRQWTFSKGAFTRGQEGIFSFYSGVGVGNHKCSRGVVVCGEGL